MATGPSQWRQRLLVAAPVMALLLAAVAVLSLHDQGTEDRTELAYFRPETQVYRAAGHYSPKTGRYPVDNNALKEYLRHQPDSTLRTLSRGPVPGPTQEVTGRSALGTRGREGREGEGAQGEGAGGGGRGRVEQAVSEYWKHQPTRTRQAIAGQVMGAGGEREREREREGGRGGQAGQAGGKVGWLKAQAQAHRSRIEDIAAKILGKTAEEDRGLHAMERQGGRSEGGGGGGEEGGMRGQVGGEGGGEGERGGREGEGEGGERGAVGGEGTKKEGKNNGKVMKVVGMLQKEIRLDTEAIAAFRGKVERAARAPKAQRQAAMAALAPQVQALRERNEKLAQQVAGVPGPAA